MYPRGVLKKEILTHIVKELGFYIMPLLNEKESGNLTIDSLTTKLLMCVTLAIVQKLSYSNINLPSHTETLLSNLTIKWVVSTDKDSFDATTLKKATL